MDMLVFISKTPERSLHYKSSSKIAGVIDVFGRLITCVSLGLVAGPITLCAWGGEQDFSQILSAEVGVPTSAYCFACCFAPYGFEGSEHGLIGRKHLPVGVRPFFYEFFLLSPPAALN